jgi:serine/threonine-protein kinase RsbW
VTEVSVLSTHENAGSGTDIPDVVEVRLPASSVYLSVLRTATAGLAARLNFTLDEIEDLRIAVDEACAMLLPQATPGEKFTCTFTLDENALDVHVRVATSGGSLPERDTFAWTVLSALAGDVDSGVDPDATVWIRLHKRRAVLGTR